MVYTQKKDELYSHPASGIFPGQRGTLQLASKPSDRLARLHLLWVLVYSVTIIIALDLI